MKEPFKGCQREQGVYLFLLLWHFFASRGRAAPWPLGLVGCLHVPWGTVHPHAYFYLLSFLIRYEMAKGAKCQETVCFPSFYGTFKRLNESKRELQFELKWFAKKNHIFSYCHCCCHVKFSYLTISVLCDVFTYFITSHWSCCFSLGACLRQSVASKHTYRLEK